MATDDYLAFFTNKKLLPYDLMQTYFFDYLRNILEDTYGDVYRLPGVFDSQATVTGPAEGQISVPGAFDGVDGNGKKFIFSAVDSRLQTVPFENSNSIVYHVGLRSIDIVDELDVNPRTGQPEYRRKMETIGTMGTPDAVVDNGSTITLTVDSVTESGYSHAGRTVRVYLATPQATTWANSYEDCTVSWDSTNNKITTTGLLGQTTGLVSETAADYVVVEIGPIIVRQSTEDLRSVDGVCFLAAVTGTAGAPSPDMSDQNVISGSLSDLDQITRTGTNGDLKVSVRAHASDTDEDQFRVEDSGGTSVWGVNEAGELYFYNTDDYIPLDDSSDLGSIVPPFTGGSILGSINQVGNVATTAIGPMVLTGFTTPAGSGGNFTMSAGRAWVPGANGFSGGVIKIDSPSIAVSDGTAYIYLHPTNGLSQTTTKGTAYTGGNLVLYYVTFSGGSLTASTDLAFRAGEIHRRGVITVGSGGAGSPSSNFTNIKAALDYIDTQSGQDSDYWPNVELWIVDNIDIGTDDVIVGANSDGLTIRGINKPTVGYGDSNSHKHIFSLEADGVRFIDLHFKTTYTASAGDTYYFIIQESSASGKNAVFEDCTFSTASNNAGSFFNGVADFDGVVLRNCKFFMDNSSSTYSSLFYTDVCDFNNWRFSDCYFEGAGTHNDTYIDEPDGDKVFDLRFDRCEFYGFEGTNCSAAADDDIVLHFSECWGEIGRIENGEFINCVFDGRIQPSSNYDVVKYIGGELSGVDLIQKNFSTCTIDIRDAKLWALTGSTYVVGGTDTDYISIIGCYIAGGSGGDDVAPSTAALILGTGCMLQNCYIEKLRTSSVAGYPMILVNDYYTTVLGNIIEASNFCECVKITNYYANVTGNRISNPTQYSTGTTAVGVSIESNYCVVSNNVISGIGGSTYGGVGIYDSGDYNVISGNMIYNVKGSGIYFTSAASNSTCFGNMINSVGLATQTNSKTGTVDISCIEVRGGYIALTGNFMSVAPGYGIEVVGSSAFRSSISGNVTATVTGSDTVNLDSNTQNNIVQLNMSPNGPGSAGVTDNGTNNLVGANGTDNNY